MTIERMPPLYFEVDAVDVAFWDDDVLFLTTPSADLSCVSLKPGSRKPEVVCAADRLLGQVARALGKAVVGPASGGYPRLAVSSKAGAAAVNTHDMVVLACPLRGDATPRLVLCDWGQYHPRLAFSPDGSRLLISADELIVFDTGSWRCYKPGGGGGVCAWHPREPWLLRLEPTSGQLHWLDLRDTDRPRTWSAGALDPPRSDDDVVGCAIDVTGERLVVIGRDPHRIEWWQLDPLRRIDTRPVCSGEPLALNHGGEAGVFATVTEGGAQLWSFESAEPISEVLPDVSAVEFSPSGRRFVTLSRASTHPHALAAGRAGRAPVLWQVQR